MEISDDSRYSSTIIHTLFVQTLRFHKVGLIALQEST